MIVNDLLMVSISVCYLTLLSSDCSLTRKSCSAYSNTIKMALSSNNTSSNDTTFSCLSSLHNCNARTSAIRVSVCVINRYTCLQLSLYRLIVIYRRNGECRLLGLAWTSWWRIRGDHLFKRSLYQHVIRMCVSVNFLTCFSTAPCTLDRMCPN